MHELLDELVYSFQDYVKPLKKEKKEKFLALIQELKALAKGKDSAIADHVDLLSEEMGHVLSALERFSYVIDLCMKIKEDLMEL